MKIPLPMLVAYSLLATAPICPAKGPDAINDLGAALAKAKAEQKMLFVQYGREACGNCQALKKMIAEKDVRLAESKFVYADVNCDDAATSQAFKSKFKVEGTTLPFVVIADAEGKQLAARTGYGSAKEWEELIKQAQKAAKKAGGS
ncbi:MAG: thioredoxin family protein [Verrucomicrobiae bacterium]|nr:thioredoxin family protein [Verrucomicrobiae bacterium]